ncbi:hypothetical protein MTR_8g027335 [Medicago truncatula]|uniref:Uncharacterized protein n=1 Tax=Medicago truncatula TaxID=3880 RepID=A0A072TN15_MEDTR|nr:hypothetical protein MTR_8g027335 [Medicago truncatula]
MGLAASLAQLFIWVEWARPKNLSAFGLGFLGLAQSKIWANGSAPFLQILFVKIVPIQKGEKFSQMQCPKNDLERKEIKCIPYASVVETPLIKCSNSTFLFNVGYITDTCTQQSFFPSSVGSSIHHARLSSRSSFIRTLLLLPPLSLPPQQNMPPRHLVRKTFDTRIR